MSMSQSGDFVKGERRITPSRQALTSDRACLQGPCTILPQCVGTVSLLDVVLMLLTSTTNSFTMEIRHISRAMGVQSCWQRPRAVCRRPMQLLQVLLQDPIKLPGYKRHCECPSLGLLYNFISLIYDLSETCRACTNRQQCTQA